MQIHTFAADSAADAIAQIREQLGPEAVVLSVKKLPAPGLGRLWQRPRIELLACVPDKPQAASDALGEIKSQLAELRQEIETHKDEPQSALQNISSLSSLDYPAEQTLGLHADAHSRQTTDEYRPQLSQPHSTESGLNLILENMGILPLYAQTVIDRMRTQQKPFATRTIAQEIELANATLRKMWRSSTVQTSNTHIFIGPPGTGKTTIICKWLAQTVLMDNRPARVWRLDGSGPNTAESLSVYGEILGIPIERFATDPSDCNPNEMLFVDLPGVNYKDSESVHNLVSQIETLPHGYIHLVLNAAYETSLLLQQARAFATFPISNLILTHLDEEQQWSKLWNLVLGTNYSIGYLSAGQNIPGDFLSATPQGLFTHQSSYK